MSLRNKLLISFLAIVSVAVLVVIIGLSIISNFNSIFDDIILEDLPTLIALGDAKAVGIGLIESVRGLEGLNEREQLEEIAEFEERSQELSNLLVELEGGLNEYTQVQPLRLKVGSLQMATGSYVNIVTQENFDTNTLETVGQALEQAEEDYLIFVDELITQFNDELEPEIQEIKTTIDNLLIFATIAGIFLVIGAIIFGIYFANTIIRPLSQLTDAAQRLGQGEIDVQVPVNSTDEIGILAQSFNQMAIALQQTTVSRDYVENILQAMGSALIVANGKGHIQTSNAFAQQLLAYSENELLDRDVDTLFDSLDTLRFDAVTTRTTMIAHNGETVPVMLSRRKIGASDLIVYNAQDLSQLEKVQKQLLAAQSEIALQSKRTNRLYTMIDLMLKQLNSVFEHGASREELRGYMKTLNEEFEKLHQIVSGRD